MDFCAILGTHVADTPGGAELQSQFICSELANRGHDSYYVAYDSDSETLGEREGVEVHRMQTSGTRDIARRLSRKLQRVDPDVVYLRNLEDIWVAVLSKRSTNAHVVFNVSHDAQCLPRFAGWPGKTDATPIHTLYRRAKLGVRRSLLTVPDTVLVQTTKQKRLLETHRGVESTLTGNGHPVPANEPDKRSPPVVLWLASIKAWKQPHKFVDLAAACEDLECDFWLVGRPSNPDLATEIEKRAASLSNVSYRGGCTFAESNDYIERASVFVNTSKQEGFPNTFIQSWFRKTPVVSLHTDPTDGTSPYTTGYYALGNLSDVVSRVRELVTNDAHRIDVGEQAFAYARKNSDIRKIVDRIEAALPDQLTGSTTPAHSHRASTRSLQ